MRKVDGFKVEASDGVVVLHLPDKSIVLTRDGIEVGKPTGEDIVGCDLGELFRFIVKEVWKSGAVIDEGTVYFVAGGLRYTILIDVEPAVRHVSWVMVSAPNGRIGIDFYIRLSEIQVFVRTFIPGYADEVVAEIDSKFRGDYAEFERKIAEFYQSSVR